MVRTRGLINKIGVEEIGMGVMLVDKIMFLDVHIVTYVGVLITLKLGVRKTRGGYSSEATGNQEERVSTNFN